MGYAWEKKGFLEEAFPAQARNTISSEERGKLRAGGKTHKGRRLLRKPILFNRNLSRKEIVHVLREKGSK